MVGNELRKMNVACMMKCGGKRMYPFATNPKLLEGMNSVCFGDCMNINLENGPYLRDLGEIPQGSIPKKFIWAGVAGKETVDFHPKKEEAEEGNEDKDEE